VREVAGNVPNMTYSTVVYPVDIRVERGDAAAAPLTAVATSNGAAIDVLAFENIYGSMDDVNLPSTGDDSNLRFFIGALLAAAAGFVLLRRRA